MTDQGSPITRRIFLARAGAAGAALSTVGALGVPNALAASQRRLTELARAKALHVRTWGAYAGTLDPVEVPTYLEFQTIAPCWEGLMAWKPGTTQAVNCLAEEIDVSSDGLRIKFKVKKGIPFHRDYGEVTARDVAFSLGRAANSPKNTDAGAKYIERVRVTGKYTGEIILKSLFAPFTGASLARWNYAIVSAKAVHQLGDKFKLTPVMTGPFYVDAFDPTAGTVRLKRFQHYGGASSGYQHIGNASEIDFAAILDDNTAAIALKSGQLNFTWLGPSVVSQFAKSANSKYNVSHVGLLGTESLYMNVQYPGLDNPTMRKAIQYAVDPNAIIQGAYNGLNQRATRLIDPLVLGSWPQTPIINQDVKKAKDLFKQAGSPSTSFEVLVITNAAQKTAAEIIVGQLQNVGINAHINALDVPTWLSHYSDVKGDQLTYSVSAANLDPANATGDFICSMVGRHQWTQWCNNQYTRLWQQGIAVKSAKARVPTYHSMSALFERAHHHVYVAKTTQFYAGLKTVKPVFSGLGYALYHLFQL